MIDSLALGVGGLWGRAFFVVLDNGFYLAGRGKGEGYRSRGRSVRILSRGEGWRAPLTALIFFLFEDLSGTRML